MQEDVARKKEVKEEDPGSGNSRTDSFNSGSGADYRIHVLLGWELGEVNVKQSNSECVYTG
jgi:hypothetical protein